jgi:16S rRNA processing protein RimM
MQKSNRVGSFIPIGEIVRPHGIRGDVKVYALTERPGLFTEFQNFYMHNEAGQGEWVSVENVRVKSNIIVLKLKGIDNREEAESLRGNILEISADDFPPLPEGSYYVLDLIGLKVTDVNGVEIGLIVDVLSMPTHDVYVVDRNGAEVLIPAVEEFIKLIDIEKGNMVVKTITGLLEDDES